MMGRILSALVLALVLLGAAPRGDVWLVASDIHLNPFDASAQPSPYRKDGNAALLRSLLAAMRAAAPDPDVVVLPGDFLAHHFDVRSHVNRESADAAGLRAMAAIAVAFGRAFPHSRFAVALGNNDMPCGDYRTDFATPYARALSAIWAPLLRRGAEPQAPAELANFGYYAMRPYDGTRIVVLDTVLFSQMARGACPGSAAPVLQRQLDWLHATLPNAPSGVRNVLLMHVPPGYDAFSTQIARGFLAWPFLRTPWNARLVQTITDPRDRVAFAIAGHTHRFDLRVAGDVPIAVFGAVSPIYENNPLFYRVRVDRNAALRDVDSYAFDEATQRWTGPHDFDTMWNVDGIDARTVRALHEQLGRDEQMRTAWGAASNGWPSYGSAMSGMWRARWRIAWCAQVELTNGFEDCAGISKRVAFTRIGVLAGALLVLAALGLLIAVIVRTTVKRR
jgi:sphingomyelin phosphodiesterase acid-like 3